MFALLKHLHDNQIEMSFLFPGLEGKQIKGKVEAIEESKATILSSIDGTAVRIVTHPNSVILIEQPTG